ncbi:MAG: bile acid:sodium symporter family protein [Chloroflexi bacterium]|nr:bile acid:sodium symporter family protein [Chloroflexota bacterium]
MDSTLHFIAQVGILAGVFTSMLAVGASVGVDQILESLRDTRTLLLALVANFLAVPLLALFLAQVLPLDADARTAVILLGAVAGAPLLPKLAELSSGHIPFSIGLMVVLMLATVGYAPLVLPLLLPHVTVAPGDIARSLIASMLLPLGIGLLGRARYPKIAGWSPELHRVSGAGMAIGLTAGLLVGWQNLVTTIGSVIFVGAAFLGLGAIAIGWGLAAPTVPTMRRVVALGAGMRNFSAALLVASRDFGGETLVMTMAATIMLIVVLAVAAGEMGRGMGGRVMGDPYHPTPSSGRSISGS